MIGGSRLPTPHAAALSDSVPSMTGVTVVDHPLVARHLSVLRDKATPSSDFRRRLSDISMLLLFESLRDLRVREDAIETPLETTAGMRLADEIVVIAILRAGLGMTDGALRLIPEARVGHLGLYRDEESLQPVGYYESVPRHAADAEVVVVDPMLATGGSAVSALDRLKRDVTGRLRFVCLVAAPEGIKAVRERHPDVPIFCAAIDRELDERGYIRPGLGDAGDRIFGTE
jgi:uracil phosphoribosyltransferase